MALQIENITPTHVSGILDDALRFQISPVTEGMQVDIGTWSHRLLGPVPKSIREMRSMAYEALARYRETGNKIAC